MPAGTFGTAYELEGLTCGHCVESVTTAVRPMADVDSATVDLVAGGTSTLTVSGSATTEDIRAAVAAAGYTVTGS
ncbi:heavy-metal-associated domain-containing protein [Specibacter cremeus]|uniref:heavy-metal-associated domain-containing protein n=1 Tax=Specibacter cremeus TaxID=1629051 RepID=UPI0013DD8A3F|nr:heavy-metal-associated domain-containing protein [Specibacter cremeus]